MNAINYAKYTSNGNNFVILDEIKKEHIPEAHKSQFSKMICHETTGIGCDTLIIVQRYNKDILNKIYRKDPLETAIENNNKKFIMRVFERDGSESYNCGNGLICLGHHLHHTYLVENASIATEIPSTKPFFRKIKSLKNNLFQATLGKPQLPDNDFVTPDAIKTVSQSNKSYRLKEIPIMIERGRNNETVHFNHCYMTFTGEPHIVIFEPALFTTNKKSDGINSLFCDLFESETYMNTLHNNTHLIQHIGLQFNALKIFFPKGININFAKLLDNGKIAYRCFERGVNKETFACGTGATAVASVARDLRLTDENDITILPWRARYESNYKDAEIIIKIKNQQYKLLSQSVLLSEGVYYFPSLHSRTCSIVTPMPAIL